MDTPLVSIIISTKNRYGEFIKCLESVKEHTKVPHEIIIVDAGSTDGTREKLSDGTLGNNISILLETPVPGFAQGNNLAMKMAKGKYIYLLNNDNWVTNNWLEHMIELYERNPKIGHMSSLILWPDDKVQSAGANVTNDGASISICSGACVKNVPTILPKDQRAVILPNCFPIFSTSSEYNFKIVGDKHPRKIAGRKKRVMEINNIIFKIDKSAKTK